MGCMLLLAWIILYYASIIDQVPMSNADSTKTIVSQSPSGQGEPDDFNPLQTIKLSKGSMDNGSAIQVAKCHPHTSIYFLQIVKTGSTTIQNLLNRIRLLNQTVNLAFFHQYPYPDPDTVRFLSDSARAAIESGKRFNLLHQHSVYNESAVKMMMQKDTVNVISLRYPLQQFVSLFYYTNLDKYIFNPNVKNPHEVFLSNPDHYDQLYRVNGMFISITKHPIARGLGYYINDSPMLTERFVQMALRNFPHVIILEYFYESLILLKRKLCLPMEYVALFITMRSRKDTTHTLPKQLQQNHKRFSPVDYRLYQSFLNRFKVELSQQPKDFWEEVSTVQDVSSSLTDYCINICSLAEKHIAEYSTKNLTIFIQMVRESTDLRIPFRQHNQPARYLRLLDCILFGMGPLEFELAYHNVLTRQNVTCEQKYVYCYDTETFMDYINKSFTNKIYELLRGDTLLFC